MGIFCCMRSRQNFRMIQERSKVSEEEQQMRSMRSRKERASSSRISKNDSLWLRTMHANIPRIPQEWGRIAVKKKLQNLKSVSDCYLCFEKLSTQAWACTIKIQFTSDCPHGSIFLIIVFFNALGTQLFLIIGSVHTLLVIIFMYWIKSV